MRFCGEFSRREGKEKEHVDSKNVTGCVDHVGIAGGEAVGSGRYRRAGRERGTGAEDGVLPLVPSGRVGTDGLGGSLQAQRGEVPPPGHVEPFARFPPAADRGGAGSLRSFIDSGVEGLFARDIAKSFLRVVTSAEERRAIGGLIGEIEQPARRLPVAPSPGYWTFLGEQTHYEQSLAGGRICLENRAVDGAASLVISRVAR